MTTQTLAQRIVKAITDEMDRQYEQHPEDAYIPAGSGDSVVDGRTLWCLDGNYDLNACADAVIAAIGWQPMSSAPTDGTHCILAVRSGPFIFSVQGAYLSGEWCAAFIDGPVEPLAWMPTVRLPEWVMQSN